MRWSQHHSAVEGWRVCAITSSQSGASNHDREEMCSRACATAVKWGLDTLAVPMEWLDDADAAAVCLHRCARNDLRFMIDADVNPAHGARAVQELARTLSNLSDHQPGVAVLLRGLTHTPRSEIETVLAALREAHRSLLISIWTPGMSSVQVAALAGLGIDAVYSSLPWWDFRAAWLIEEYERLRAVANVIAPVADHRAATTPVGSDAERRLAAAALVGDGMLVPVTVLLKADSGKAALVGGSPYPAQGSISGPQRLTGPLTSLTALFRSGATGRLMLVNPDADRAGAVSRGLIEQRLPDGFVLDQNVPQQLELEGGAWTWVPVRNAEYIVEHGMASSQLRRSLSNAVRAPRIAIEAVSPAVDGGAFPVKRILGETVSVRANIFMDGHEELAAEVLWRAVNEPDWERTAMSALGNDAWEAHLTPRRLGRYVYVIRAWHDRWASYCVQLRKKADAGVDVSVDVEEGRRMLADWVARTPSKRRDAGTVIEQALTALGAPVKAEPPPKRKRSRATESEHADETPVIAIPPATREHVDILLSESLAQAIHAVDEPAFETQTSTEYPLSIDRSEATFASWYELFPRSQSPVAGRHGTLQDVIAQLPRIRQMGFDVLYFPPIHPIGTRNRKGRNNALQAGPDDPGSPYAIGAPEGGHDAVHPELGTLDDFRELVEAARRNGMELALDFAIQCSPDHPWLRDHPDWFNWRVDGTLKYAENPPKRYEDIVNPDFYSPLASSPRQAALWRALRDIVLFWAQQGVRIFRVDNPHTKPLPFWEWMLREVRERHPDTIFLSEAFTRPAMMYRLAKVGFSQSYTYFTWRNSRQELTDYMTELNSLPVRDFFRPNFFVNTPDINPRFLQTSGRAGFLIRAVLASTLSGSWGVYNGFELCEATPVPGKEEYLDSEKYQLRQWDHDRPGNIIEEITRLNRIRRSQPALQSHLGIRFHETHNDQILFYSRHSPADDSIVLVAVSLDPHHSQSGRLVLRRHDWALPDWAPLPLHDLFEDRRFVVHGDSHPIELTPTRPFVIWALTRNEGAAA